MVRTTGATRRSQLQISCPSFHHAEEYVDGEEFVTHCGPGVHPERQQGIAYTSIR